MRTALLCAVSLVAQAQGLSIQGTVLGQDGKPMPLAHARILPLGGGAPLAEVQADATGRFQLKVEGQGFVRFQATGVGQVALSGGYAPLMTRAFGRRN